jgi:lipopolysaccharide/colanic/teichoic acid biosynthesis glycosyltransferase
MWLGKRFFDFVCSLIGLIFLSPLFLIIIIWIKTDSKGPIFFRQKRVGLNEKPFFIHKFRTMQLEAESKGLQITVGIDPRITKSGHVLRKFKLDELPQLIDVVVGDMSLVGPRPEVPKYVEAYNKNTRAKIFKMRPGITDWASIKYKDENAILSRSNNPEQAYINEVLPKKLSYSESYLENASFREDLKIIFSTFLEIIRKRESA